MSLKAVLSHSKLPPPSPTLVQQSDCQWDKIVTWTRIAYKTVTPRSTASPPPPPPPFHHKASKFSCTITVPPTSLDPRMLPGCLSPRMLPGCPSRRDAIVNNRSESGAWCSQPRQAPHPLATGTIPRPIRVGIRPHWLWDTLASLRQPPR